MNLKNIKSIIKEEVQKVLAEDSKNDAYLTAGEMISQIGLYTQQNADKRKADKSRDYQRFSINTPQEEAEIIKISEEYKGYLAKLKAAVDALTKNPLYQVAVGDAGGRYRDRGIGATIEKAYYRSTSNLNEVTIDPTNAASEVLSMLAHPDLKKGMDILADTLDDAQYMAIKKHYDALYNELKKHE